jgi:hypothetical protein
VNTGCSLHLNIVYFDKCPSQVRHLFWCNFLFFGLRFSILL